MKNRDERIKDTRRYLDGEMSDRERNAFEKKLQGDPFEEEALEGLSGLSSDDLKKDIGILDARLKRRVHKRTPLYYRIAAAVVVLMAISSLFLVRELRKPAMMMSDNIVVLQDTTEEEIMAPGNVAVDRLREDISEAAGENASRRSVVPAENPAKEQDEEIVDDMLTLDIQAEREEVFEHVEAEEEVKVKVPAENIKAEAAEKAMEVEEPEKTMEAKEKVKAVEAEALISEEQLVSAARSKKGSKSAVPVKAEEQADMEIRSVALAEGQAISTSGIKADRSAEPFGGMKEFKTYLETDQIFPADWNASDREIVKLEVTIGTAGKIKDIKIIKSPDHQFSEEAKRLLNEGPPWLPATTDSEKIEDRVKIRIVFKR